MKLKSGIVLVVVRDAVVAADDDECWGRGTTKAAAKCSKSNETTAERTEHFMTGPVPGKKDQESD